MADKHTLERTPPVDASVLSGEIISLASKRLDALCEQSRRDQVAKILKRLRKKWRKRHKLLSLDAQGKLVVYTSRLGYK